MGWTASAVSAVEAGAWAYLGATADHRAADQEGTRAHSRAFMHEGLAATVPQGGRRRDPADEVGRAADEVLGRTHVPPVRVIDVCVDVTALGEQPGEHLTLDRHRQAGRDGFDDLALEHIGAGIDLVGRRVLGLLQERGDPAVGVGRDAAERAGVADPHEVDGDVGVGGAVTVDDVADIGATEDVAVEHHDRARGQFVEDVADTAAGAQRLVFGDVAHAQAQLRTVAVVLAEDLGLERGAEHDVADTGRPDTGQQMGQERQPGGGQHRFRRRQGEWAQAGSLPADEDDGLDVLPDVVRSPHGRSFHRLTHGVVVHWIGSFLEVTGVHFSIHRELSLADARRAARTASRDRTSRPMRNARRSGARHGPGLRSAWNR